MLVHVQSYTLVLYTLYTGTVGSSEFEEAETKKRNVLICSCITNELSNERP